VYLGPRDRARSFALAACAYPVALGLCAMIVGRGAPPRFDTFSRIVAATTALGYFVSVASWFVATGERVSVVVAVAESRPRAPVPAFRAPALGILCGVCMFVSVLVPAVLATREPTTFAERIAGDVLVRGRSALVTAVGMSIALALALYGVPSLLRAQPSRSRSPSRAMVYVAWAMCVGAIRIWFDQSK
jgi:hypothetical protein